MRLVLASIVAVGASAALTESEYEFHFVKWVQEHEKNYASDTEFAERYRIFQSNLDMVNKHNQGNHTYTMAMNQFGDLSWAEFRSNYLGYNHVQTPYLRSLNEEPLSAEADLADIDWTTKGAVTPVKNQGQCGSCWSFSATGAFEGAYQIANQKLISFSEQQLVDCGGSSGNQGCHGGLMDNAFEWWMKNGGACLEDDYPYTGRDNSCKKTCKAVATPKGYADVKSGSETGLATSLQTGPVSIAIQADQSAFQFYRGGVMSGRCGTSLDHGVLLVGMGTDAGKDYWKVKNSWGASWGEKGYIRLIRGINQCGLSLAASRPTL